MQSPLASLPLLIVIILSSIIVLFFHSGKSLPLSAGDLADENSLWDLYGRWAMFHKIGRSKSEWMRRFGVFAENARFVHSFNSKKKVAGSSIFQVELNAFGDLTNEEFLSMYTGYKKDVDLRGSAGNHSRIDAGASLNLTAVPPPSIDWREQGVVTAVKDQGSCGCCWAFSTVATVESLLKIKTDSLIPLSEQALVDCDASNYGCQGGRLDYAYDFMLNNGGIPSEENYPYTGNQSTCNTTKLKPTAASIAEYRYVTPNDEDALVQAVATVPVAVAIDAGGSAFQFYKSGVFTGPCGRNLNHAVALVGYTSTYWIAKNSWGTEWGNSGYILMARGNDSPYGLCGINMSPVYPV